MPEAVFAVRAAQEEDRYPLAVLFAKVAEERDGIAAEPPMDVEHWAAWFDLDRTIVAEGAAEIIGGLWVSPFFGPGEIASAGVLSLAPFPGKDSGKMGWLTLAYVDQLAVPATSVFLVLAQHGQR